MVKAVKLSDERVKSLLEGALRGCEYAFLTKPGSTRYGAAVLTSSGRIFTSGQYSSFNHTTNIHAEMGAVLMATMSGDVEVVALALVSTAAKDGPARPCGVCRQFLHEHSQRTGRDMLVIMADKDGEANEAVELSNLLPFYWTARSRSEGVGEMPWGTLPPWNPRVDCLNYGDQVQTEDRYLSIVWAPEWEPGTALLKVKYDARLPPAGDGRPHKLAHSFSGYELYRNQLRERGVTGRLPGGEPAYIVAHDHIQGRVPRLKLGCADLARKPVDTTRLEALIEVLSENEIDLNHVSLTGSWAVGLGTPKSDFDLVIEAGGASVDRLRKAIVKRIQDKVFLAPEGSATWMLLESTGKSAMDLIKEGRFAETFTLPGADPTRCSIIYVRPQPEAVRLPIAPEVEGLGDFEGRILDASQASFKRARYTVEIFNDGSVLEVECWHKWAGLLRDRDRVKVTGIICRSDRHFMLQMNPHLHSIEWLEWK